MTDDGTGMAMDVVPWLRLPPMCSTDAQGMGTLVLQGERSLAVTPVLLLVESEENLLTNQMPVDFVPPATRDIAVTVPS